MSCEYCENKKMLDTYFEIMQKNEVKYLYYKEKRIEYKFPINFCPMCGEFLGENKPLTEIELLEMKGKPIFVKKLQAYVSESIIGWQVINLITEGHPEFKGHEETKLYFKHLGIGMGLSSYGKIWTAYRYEIKD